MNAIAGIAWLESSPRIAHSARSQIQILCASARGAAAVGIYSHAGLGAAGAETAPEDGPARQLVEQSATGCALVWDGRLDNREELLAQIGGEVAPGAPATDAEITLRAYLRWGEECFSRLLGDFAILLWDPRTRRLLAARDFMGARPLFYSLAGEHIHAASSVEALLRIPEVPRDFDERTVSESLLWWAGFPDVERTFFSAIRRLPPGHWLRWDAGGLMVTRYWQLDPRKVIRYRRHAEYAEHLGVLLSDAVACRTRRAGRAGILLSGGMDSSCVALLAARRAESRANLYTYHLQLAGEHDEIGLARLVAQQAEIPFRSQPLPAGNVLPLVEETIRLHGAPHLKLDMGNDTHLLRMAAADGCGVILTGDASDELSGHPGAFVADLIRRARVGRLLRELPAYAGYFGASVSLGLREALPYLAPRSALRIWRRLKWRRAPAWIHPELARRTHLLDRMRAVRPRLPFESLSTEEDFHTLTRGRRVMADECRERVAALHGLQYGKPFYDRRLVEYMMAVPAEEKVVRGQFKSLLREIPGLLPEPLRNIRRKANYDPHFAALWRRQDWKSWRPLFEDPPGAAGDFVDLQVARQVCRAFLDQEDWSHQALFLHLGGFFIWLRAISQVRL